MVGGSTQWQYPVGNSVPPLALQPYESLVAMRLFVGLLWVNSAFIFAMLYWEDVDISISQETP